MTRLLRKEGRQRASRESPGGGAIQWGGAVVISLVLNPCVMTPLGGHISDIYVRIYSCSKTSYKVVMK